MAGIIWDRGELAVSRGGLEPPTGRFKIFKSLIFNDLINYT
jgi:hypothetical protein